MRRAALAVLVVAALALGGAVVRARSQRARMWDAVERMCACAENSSSGAKTRDSLSRLSMETVVMCSSPSLALGITDVGGGGARYTAPKAPRS